jgi:ABC-type iron transport system FetAB permease component
MSKWWLWLVLAVAIVLATAIAYERIPEGSHSPFIWLFAPGFIGEVLLGGVHGGEPESVLKLGWCIANGLFWTGALRLVFALYVATIAARERGLRRSLLHGKGAPT